MLIWEGILNEDPARVAGLGGALHAISERAGGTSLAASNSAWTLSEGTEAEVSAPGDLGGSLQVDQPSYSLPLNPSPMSAPTATPQTSNATCSRSTWMGWCSGFELSGRSSTWRSSFRK